MNNTTSDIYFRFPWNELKNLNIFIGGRGTGKTFWALENVIRAGEKFIFLRDTQTVIDKLIRGGNLFNPIMQVYPDFPKVEMLSDDGMYKFCLTADNIPVKTFGYIAALSTFKNLRGVDFSDVDTIIFDEFLTRKYYLPNEPILFENLVSSIVRENDKAKIIMLANTVSWEAPYFAEWGLGHIRGQKQGTYDIYQSNNGGRKIVVCYTAHAGAKKSDIYFNFDNPRRRMIIEGTWETAMYPRIPDNMDGWSKGIPCYIQTADEVCVKIEPAQTPDGMAVILCWECGKLIVSNEYPYVDKRYKDRIIYTDFFVPAANVKMAITKHADKYSKFILDCFKQGRVFYANNTVGENVRNYLKYSTQYTPIPS